MLTIRHYKWQFNSFQLVSLNVSESYLLYCVVWFLGWHIQETFLSLTKFPRFFVEFLFVLFHTTDSIFSKIFQRHHNLIMSLCQLKKKKLKNDIDIELKLSNESISMLLKLKVITTLTILSRSSSILTINLLKCLRLSTITCSSSVCVDPMHSKLNSAKLLANWRCARDKSINENQMSNLLMIM